VSELEAAPFGEVDQKVPPERLRADIIMSSFQASDAEIKDTLTALNAMLIDDHWRLLAPSYLMGFFEMMLANCVLADVDPKITCIDRIFELTHDCDHEYPMHIRKHVFTHYSRLENEQTILDSSKICKLFGEQLLRAKSAWALEDFEKAWIKLVGDLQPSIVMLKGLFLLDSDIAGNSLLKYYPAHKLPATPEKRFEVLFAVRERWVYEDIFDFISEIGKLHGNADALIVKYCRISTGHDGTRHVTSKLVQN
jgi:hypothetical protein